MTTEGSEFPQPGPDLRVVGPNERRISLPTTDLDPMAPTPAVTEQTITGRDGSSITVHNGDKYESAAAQHVAQGVATEGERAVVAAAQAKEAHPLSEGSKETSLLGRLAARFLRSPGGGFSAR